MMVNQYILFSGGTANKMYDGDGGITTNNWYTTTDNDGIPITAKSTNNIPGIQIFMIPTQPNTMYVNWSETAPLGYYRLTFATTWGPGLLTTSRSFVHH